MSSGCKLFLRTSLALPLAFWASGSAPLRAAESHELPEGKGKATMQRICSGCHAPEIVMGKHLAKDGWEQVVSSMVEKGANGTDDEFSQIIDYLAANFPKTTSGDKSNQK